MKLQVTAVKDFKCEANGSYKINASSSETCNLRKRSYIHGMSKGDKKSIQMSNNSKTQFNMQNIQFTPEGQLKEIGVTFNVKAQLGRPVNPNSVRQQRLAKAPGRKTGRPVNPLSARQERLHQLAMKRIKGDGVIKRGRPVDATSDRQVRLAELAVRRAAGEVKRGRPVGSGKKGNSTTTVPSSDVMVVTVGE